MTNISLTNKNIKGGGLSGSAGYGGVLKQTDQLTVYHLGDDGDYERGLSHSYTILTTGQFAGTTNIDTPHYAAATISFTAPSTISDAAAGLVTILTGDTVVVSGSTSNDGVYTVAGGGVAGAFTVNEITIVNEIAGDYVTLFKRTAPSNNCVQDNITGLMWKRYTTGTIGAVELVGEASTGLLKYYNAANGYILHPAAADLQMMTTGVKVVAGAGEIDRYWVGMPAVFTGFVNAVNNLPGYVVTSVAVNGADLDILLDTNSNTLLAEAAGGLRTIRVDCRSIFSYCASANLNAYAGFSDWRVPNVTELLSLANWEAATAAPDAAAFPNWPTATYFFSATTAPANTTEALAYLFGVSTLIGQGKTNQYNCELVRG